MTVFHMHKCYTVAVQPITFSTPSCGYTCDQSYKKYPSKLNLNTDTNTSVQKLFKLYILTNNFRKNG